MGVFPPQTIKPGYGLLETRWPLYIWDPNYTQDVGGMILIMLLWSI